MLVLSILFFAISSVDAIPPPLVNNRTFDPLQDFEILWNTSTIWERIVPVQVSIVEGTVPNTHGSVTMLGYHRWVAQVPDQPLDKPAMVDFVIHIPAIPANEKLWWGGKYSVRARVRDGQDNSGPWSATSNQLFVMNMGIPGIPVTTEVTK